MRAFVLMKALVLKGKHKGEEVEVLQWCNDWFMVEGEMVASAILSPVSLALSEETATEVRAHKNNGHLFDWYQMIPSDSKRFPWTFIKKRF
jgi:hypothetical protein